MLGLPEWLKEERERPTFWKVISVSGHRLAALIDSITGPGKDAFNNTAAVGSAVYLKTLVFNWI